MKPLEYILKFGFMYGLSLVFIFSIAPLFYTNAITKKEDFDQDVTLNSLTIKYYPSPKSKDFQLKLVTDKGGVLYKIYERNTQECAEVANFLNKYDFKEDKQFIADVLPFHLTENELKSLGKFYTTAENHKLSRLKIGEDYIIGKKKTAVKKIFFIFLSIFFAILGVFGLIISSLELHRLWKVHEETGEWENLPNSVDSKIKGFHWIINGFKHKKKE